MSEYIYIELDFTNYETITSSVPEHTSIINEQLKRGYRFEGYVPTKMVSSGRIIKIDLIFRHESAYN